MEFVDQIYQLYREYMTGDEEDIIEIVLGVLEEQERHHILKLIEQMTDEELHHMMSLYLIEMLKRKLAEEGLNETLYSPRTITRFH